MDKAISCLLEEVREYIVYNDVKISCKDDLIELFAKMNDKGYFSEVKKEKRMSEARALFGKFAKAYESDKDILEKDLIFFGPRLVLEKLEKTKKR